jgi:peroxiredoxin
MRKIHVSTTVGLGFLLAGIACIALSFYNTGAILALLAYFASIKEVSKYTSWYQFSVVFISSIICGFALDLPLTGAPLLTLSLFTAALGSILRIVMFQVFSYTSYSWYEPLTFLISLALFVLAFVSGKYDWKDGLIASPIIIFQSILAWGILKDKKQLLAYTRGGYKVQIGKQASDFMLPDQDENMVKLSDFKGNRHLLLIFVRGDWCPGCHMMLRTYEKNREKFQQKNVLVMAIGPDPVGVNRGMVEKLGLDFKVLSDEGQRTAMTYGVQLKEYKNDFAEKYEEGIPLPASFLIDKNGIVRYVSRPDKVGEFLNPSLIFPIVDQLN